MDTLRDKLNLLKQMQRQDIRTGVVAKELALA